jgi:hypothetical protein
MNLFHTGQSRPRSGRHFPTLYDTLEPRCSPGLAAFSSDSEISIIELNGSSYRTNAVIRINLTARALMEKSEKREIDANVAIFN